MEFLSSAKLRAIAVFSLLNLFFCSVARPASLVSLFPGEAAQKAELKERWNKGGCLPLAVSCLLHRAAVSPHKKPEQLITCSAARITHGSRSRAPLPCSPSPMPVPASQPAMQHMLHPSPQGNPLGQLVPVSYPQSGAAGLSTGREHKPEPLAPLTLTEMGKIPLPSLLWERQCCLTCWFLLLFFFFPYSLPSKITWTAGALRKGLSFPPD